MKRNKPAKRRDRRAAKSMSPYQKYRKTPYRYSTGYYEWRSRHVRRNKREGADGRPAAA